MIQRKIERKVILQYNQGFLGKGHQQAIAVDVKDFAMNDPFIALADDQMHLPEPAGGEHPHAGFEIFTLVLEGDDEVFQKGNLELLTSGKGIVHTEQFKEKTDARILQLWTTLPPDKRWTEPFLQQIDLANVPTLKEQDKEIRVYSGSAYGLTSPLKNITPITIVDFNLKNTTTQQLPASYNGFIIVIEGSVIIGGVEIKQGETAWFSKLDQVGESEIHYKAGANGGDFVFYAGEPQNVPIVSYGPFIADTDDDIKRLYKEYRNGEMKHIKTYPSQHFTEKQGKTIN